MRRGLLAAGAGALVLGLVLAGCTGEDGGPGFSVPALGPADVDVDTPELRATKEELGIAPCPTSDAEPVEGGLPEVTLNCFGGGRNVDLSGLRGPMVVSVWGAWCPPCREEMPVLEEFDQAHGDEVALLGIDFQDVRTDETVALLRETGAKYPQVADPGGEIAGLDPFPRLRGLPYMAFVDADGVVTYEEYVVIESTDQLRDLVAEHLDVAL